MKNDFDKFESNPKKLFLEKKNKNENFFMFKDSIDMNISSYIASKESYRRLNDYDLNILQEDAYKNVSDELFKLEYKISKLEEELKVLNSQLQAARDIGDYNLIEVLNNKRIFIEKEYVKLTTLYNDKSLSARITESVSWIFGNKLRTSMSMFFQWFSKFADLFLLKLPKPFSVAVELKKSLNKLENINKSVDDLVGINSQSENFNKYEQLSKYIIKANNIQSEIKRFIKD